MLTNKSETTASASKTVNDTINKLVNVCAERRGYAYTSGYISSVLLRAIMMLPESERQMMLESMEYSINVEQNEVREYDIRKS